MTTSVPGTERLRESVAPFLSFFGGPFDRLNKEPDVANFAVGNPQEMPLAGYVEALQRQVVPQDKDWFAYKLSEPASQRTVAATMSARTGLDWDPDDVAMTTNGWNLARHAADWRAAGLSHVNVSMDSIDPETFHRITGHDKLLTPVHCGNSPLGEAL